MDEYQRHAKDFLDNTDTKFAIKWLRQGKYFPDDDYERDIYNITLTRNGRVYSFEFGQSNNCSGRYWRYGDYRRGIYTKRDKQTSKATMSIPYSRYPDWDKNKNFAEPTAYDVLACLQTYDPENFENFCSNFGYDTDSRQAEKIYQAVKNEFNSLQRLYSDTELEAMAEIQ